jgi:hypothetical protein
VHRGALAAAWSAEYFDCGDILAGRALQGYDAADAAATDAALAAVLQRRCQTINRLKYTLRFPQRNGHYAVVGSGTARHLPEQRSCAAAVTACHAAAAIGWIHAPQCVDAGRVKVRAGACDVRISTAPAFSAGALVEVAPYGHATCQQMPASNLPIQRHHDNCAACHHRVLLLSCTSNMSGTPYGAAVWLMLPSILLAASGCLAAGKGSETTSVTIGHRNLAAVSPGHTLRALLVVGGRNDPEVRGRTH